MSDATVTTSADRAVLRFERQLDQPIDLVWRAVTDPREMRAWFPTRIEIEEWKVDAPLVHHFDGSDVGPLTGVVLQWEPPTRVSFAWGEDTITFELSPAGTGATTFVLTEELSPAHAARNAAGWDTCLDRLEHGREMQQWSRRFERYSARFEPVLGPQEGPPHGVDVS